MKVVSVLNFKGGIGKTTITLNLSDMLRRHGKKVLLIDGEGQRNSTSILPDYNRETNYPYTLLQVLRGECALTQAIREARPNFYILPGHSDIDKAATHLAEGGQRTLKRLQSGVRSLTEYDFVFIDHSPSYSKITNALLVASEYMLIPVQLEPFSVEGLLTMINKLAQELAEIEYEVDTLGIVPNELDFSHAMTRAYLQDIQDYFGEQVTPYIRTDTKISKAQEKHLTVFEYDPRSKGSEDFETLAQFVLTKEGVNV